MKRRCLPMGVALALTAALILTACDSEGDKIAKIARPDGGDGGGDTGTPSSPNAALTDTRSSGAAFSRAIKALSKLVDVDTAGANFRWSYAW